MCQHLFAFPFEAVVDHTNYLLIVPPAHTNLVAQGAAFTDTHGEQLRVLFRTNPIVFAYLFRVRTPLLLYCRFSLKIAFFSSNIHIGRDIKYPPRFSSSILQAASPGPISILRSG
jgi:hypothetical protein